MTSLNDLHDLSDPVGITSGNILCETLEKLDNTCLHQMRVLIQFIDEMNAGGRVTADIAKEIPAEIAAITTRPLLAYHTSTAKAGFVLASKVRNAIIQAFTDYSETIDALTYQLGEDIQAEKSTKH